MKASSCALLILAFGMALNAPAAPVDSAKASAVVKGWLRLESSPLGSALGKQVTKVDTFKDPAGNPLYHVVYLQPAGFVIVSAEDQAEPIIAFASHGSFNPSSDNPLGALVARDLPKRVAHARSHAGTTGAAKNQAKWQKLQASLGGSTNTVTANGIDSTLITDVRVAPLLQSTWSQTTSSSGASIYNFYTPPHFEGNPTNAPCGCVATALAQLMYYYQYPTGEVGTNSFDVYFDSEPMTRTLRGGDGYGGPYDWSDMTANPDNPTPLQCQAIGALTYDAGVAVHMQYTDTKAGSGAYLTDAETAMVTTFKYGNAVLVNDTTVDVGYDLPDMINANLDAHFPVIFGIENTQGGHCIVCDGYGYSAYATLYHHLNLGWGGDDNAWYQLPAIDLQDETPYYNIDACLYNVFTNGGGGEIISGRVTDPKGNPLANAGVTAVCTKGGLFTTTTDAHGIYALAGVPSDSTCVITVATSGYFPTSSNVVTGLSFDGGTKCGNVWGANFALVPAQGPPVFIQQSPSVTVTVGSNATFFAYASGQLPLTYQWQCQLPGTLEWVNVTDNAQFSGSQSTTLTITGATTNLNGAPFQCVAVNSQGGLTSSVVTLGVASLPTISLSTMAGLAGVTGNANGIYTNALFNCPEGIAVDGQTNIFVADKNNHVIREISPSSKGWVVSTIAGQTGIWGSANGAGTNAQFNAPYGVAVDANDNVYVADTGNDLIRWLKPTGSNWIVSTIAGQALVTGHTDGASALFKFPMGIAVDGSGYLYVTDEGNHNIRRLIPSGLNWVVSTISGTGNYGTNDGTNITAAFGQPYGITLDHSGSVYVVDEYNQTIRLITPAGQNWIVSTIAGNGAGSSDGMGRSAKFRLPSGIAAGPDGNVYVADTGNGTIRSLTLVGTNWLVSTVAGIAGNHGSVDGAGTNALLNAPFGIALDAQTNVYVADMSNDNIRGPVLPSTPAPSIVHLTRQVSQNSLAVTWNAVTGRGYQLLCKTNLGQSSWTVVSSVTASNWTGVAEVPLGNEPQKYYRVVPAP